MRAIQDKRESQTEFWIPFERGTGLIYEVNPKLQRVKLQSIVVNCGADGLGLPVLNEGDVQLLNEPNQRAAFIEGCLLSHFSATSNMVRIISKRALFTRINKARTRDVDMALSALKKAKNCDIDSLFEHFQAALLALDLDTLYLGCEEDEDLEALLIQYQKLCPQVFADEDSGHDKDETEHLSWWFDENSGTLEEDGKFHAAEPGQFDEMWENFEEAKKQLDDVSYLMVRIAVMQKKELQQTVAERLQLLLRMGSIVSRAAAVTHDCEEVGKATDMVLNSTTLQTILANVAEVVGYLKEGKLFDKFGAKSQSRWARRYDARHHTAGVPFEWLTDSGNESTFLTLASQNQGHMAEYASMSKNTPREIPPPSVLRFVTEHCIAKQPDFVDTMEKELGAAVATGVDNLFGRALEVRQHQPTTACKYHPHRLCHQLHWSAVGSFQSLSSPN